MTTTNLSPSQITALIALNAERNTAEFIRLTPQTGWFFAEDMGNMIEADAVVAFTGLVEILMRQTAALAARFKAEVNAIAPTKGSTY